MDKATLEIVSVVASTNDVSYAEALPYLLEDVPVEIEQVGADGAYDQLPVESVKESDSNSPRPGQDEAVSQNPLSAALQTWL